MTVPCCTGGSIPAGSIVGREQVQAPFMLDQPFFSYQCPPPPLPLKPLPTYGAEGYLPGPSLVPYHASSAQFTSSAFASFQSGTSQISGRSSTQRPLPLLLLPPPISDQDTTILQGAGGPSVSPSPYSTSSLTSSPASPVFDDDVHKEEQRSSTERDQELAINKEWQAEKELGKDAAQGVMVESVERKIKADGVILSKSSPACLLFEDNAYKERERSAEKRQLLTTSEERKARKGLLGGDAEHGSIAESVEQKKKAEGVKHNKKDLKQEVLQDLLKRKSSGQGSHGSDDEDSGKERDEVNLKSGENTRYGQDRYGRERHGELDHSDYRSMREQPDR